MAKGSPSPDGEKPVRRRLHDPSSCWLSTLDSLSVVPVNEHLKYGHPGRGKIGARPSPKIHGRVSPKTMAISVALEGGQHGRKSAFVISSGAFKSRPAPWPSPHAGSFSWPRSRFLVHAFARLPIPPLPWNSRGNGGSEAARLCL